MITRLICTVSVQIVALAIFWKKNIYQPKLNENSARMLAIKYEREQQEEQRSRTLSFNSPNTIKEDMKNTISLNSNQYRQANLIDFDIEQSEINIAN